MIKWSVNQHHNFHHMRTTNPEDKVAIWYWFDADDDFNHFNIDPLYVEEEIDNYILLPKNWILA